MAQQLDQLVATFRNFGCIREGEMRCPFWGNEELLIRLIIDDRLNRPSDWQFKTLSAVLGHATDLRPYLEKELFSHYQSHVYGTIVGDESVDEITPPLTVSDEIWTLISAPDVIIPERPSRDTSGSVEFELDFQCHWDEEHGFAAQIDNWRITKLGRPG